MKENIKAFIKDIIPIVVGILVALWINNWNENRKDKNYLDQISSASNKELTDTNQDIKENLLLQKSYIDSIDAYLIDDKISLLDITLKNKGIYVPTIKINSWKAISNSKIELLDYKKISALAMIEEQKEMLKMKSMRLVDFLYANPKETGKDKKEFLKILMLDIIGTEESIQKDISNIITN
ncbi:hypothetical protein [Kaistella antarctica]|uniref:Uncharacterized protein n=1 Tax=Kaistella antarctica TaxID=266748 RepID=A0A3S4V220_9FLAO|nr:hypothetical protein [Kaistella antarctica]KEY19153.1 hypothetical protein HY04_12070 [Kaistella antarctica]SEW03386.1 hypothetical protein SAMN05421765_1856 [Kaistella antarctica]VEH98795.1 Uncharacterised protein [Kaistella antarctica]